MLYAQPNCMSPLFSLPLHVSDDDGMLEWLDLLFIKFSLNRALTSISADCLLLPFAPRRLRCVCGKPVTFPTRITKPECQSPASTGEVSPSSLVEVGSMGTGWGFSPDNTGSELVAKLSCSLVFGFCVRFHKDAQSSRENLQGICFPVS